MTIDITPIIEATTIPSSPSPTFEDSVLQHVIELSVHMKSLERIIEHHISEA